MIFGIGTDILSINRIARIKNLNHFANKILGTSELKKFHERFGSSKEATAINEIEYIQIKRNIVNYLSKRFCAKEAFFKALGTGIGNENMRFGDVEILNLPSGKPYIAVTQKIHDFISKNFVKTGPKDIKFHISISDEKEFSIAFVTIETV